MPASGDNGLITARTGYPDTIVVNEIARLRLGLVRDGVPVLPLAGVPGPGGFELYDPGGNVVFTGDILIDGDELAVDLSAFDTYDLELGQLYQARWYPVFSLGDVQTFRREVVVARFVLRPPVADVDLTRGNYPDLLDNLGGFRFAGSNGEATLQPFIDEAWGWVIRKLYKVGRWPDLLVSTQDVFEVTRERAWFLVFRFLFRSSGGDASRFERLMDLHRTGADKEWTSLSGRWDQNHDGFADDEDRDPASAIVHRNAAPRRRLSRSSKW